MQSSCAAYFRLHAATCVCSCAFSLAGAWPALPVHKRALLPLPPPRRIRLTSCCRTLRARTLSSRHLWGSLQLNLYAMPPAYFDSLAAWLAAHKGGLHALHIAPSPQLKGEGAVVSRLLHSVVGGTLAALELSHMCMPGGALPALGQLQLTRLILPDSPLLALPAELAELPLAELSVCLWAGWSVAPALATLPRLAASLTLLKLEHHNTMGGIPTPMGTLSALRTLELKLVSAKSPSKHLLRMILHRWPALRP